MREIEFRGKRKGNGEWHYGHYVEDFVSSDPYISNRQTECHVIIPETLGQYTGLKDKNGVKIFEGDVVSIKYRITRNPHWGIPAEERIIMAEYDNETLSYGLFETMQECKGDCGEIVSVQVIGNKHDNPELLEATNG